MFDSATKQAPEYRKPTKEEWEHFLQNHLLLQISNPDGAAAVSIVGECGDPDCPTYVHSTKYCKRPPC